MIRYALIASRGTQWDNERVVARYLPDNYKVVATVGPEHLRYPGNATQAFVIAGEDRFGWTLDGYVLPRLGSGVITGEEIDLSHPAMKEVPARRDDERPALLLDGAVPRSEQERVGALLAHAKGFLDRAHLDDAKHGWFATRLDDLEQEAKNVGETDEVAFEFWSEAEDDVIAIINALLPDGLVCGVGLNDNPGDVLVLQEEAVEA